MIGKSQNGQIRVYSDFWLVDWLVGCVLFSVPHRKFVQWKEDLSQREENACLALGNLKTAAFCKWCSKQTFGSTEKAFIDSNKES